ncbi:MAG: T9SS type A sorting domain-containing protein [Saprospiraceae bacterium]|nr:T9SS type A sorting domain-containing protein [Saprospiraceae bacterium]
MNRCKRCIFGLFFILIWNVSIAQSLYQNDHCSNATPISTGDKITLFLGFAGLDTDVCEIGDPLVRGIWYRITGSDKVVEFLMSNDHSDRISISVFKGNCIFLECISGASDRFYAEENIQYFILVSKSAFEFGNPEVDITIAEKESVAYDFCEGAIVAQCDSVYSIFPNQLTSDQNTNSCNEDTPEGWIKITGDGRDKQLNLSAAFFNEISFTIFDKECGNLRCLYKGSYPGISFSTIAGRDYFVSIAHDNPILTIPVRVLVTCQNNNTANVCNRALQLACGESMGGTLTDTIPPDFNSPIAGANPGLWYKIDGNGEKHKFTLSSPAIENLIIEFFLVKNDNCIDSMTAVIYNPYPLPDNTYVINAAPDEDIYVKVAYFNNPTTFILSHDCESADNNLNCEFAKTLDCGDTMDIYETASGDFGYPKTGNEGNWFAIAGNQTKYRFTGLEGVGSVDFTIHKMGCDSLQIIKKFQHFFTPGEDIYVDLPEGEDYLIKTHFPNFSWQNVVLRLSCDNPVTHLFCENALPITCGENYALSNFGTGVSLENDLCSDQQGYWYSFEGKDSLFEVVLNFPFQQYSIYEGECGNLNCLYANENFSGLRRFRVFGEFDKTYYIKMFSGNGGFPPPSFRVECREAGDNRICSLADTIQCGDEIEVFFDVPSNENTGICQVENGEWYQLEGTGELFYLESGEETEIYVFKGNCDTAECVSFATGRVNFFTQVGTTYLIKLDSRFSNSSTLLVECSPQEFNDCQLPFEVACGDTISINFSKAPTYLPEDNRNAPANGYFISLEGNDSTYVFNIVNPLQTADIYYYVFTQDCEEYETAGIIHQGVFDWVFHTETGVTYKILIVSEDAEETSFEISCTESPSGAICEKAQPIECGIPFLYSTLNRTYDPENFLHFGAWYTFAGTGDIINLFSDTIGPAYTYAVYTSAENCDSLNLLHRFFSNAEPIYWQTETGINYYIHLSLSSPDTEAENLPFILDCFENEAGESCIDAALISCGETYTTSLVGVDSSSFGLCGLSAPGAWFLIQGDDLVYELEVSNFYDYFDNVNILVASGECDSLICLSSQIVNRTSPKMSLQSEAGNFYYIKFETPGGITLNSIDFLVSCDNKAENDSCVYSQLVTCGDMISGRLGNLTTDDSTACNYVLPGLYYYIEGNGQDAMITALETDDSEITLHVFENSCGTDGICLYETYVSDEKDKILFPTEAGKVYYFRVSEEEGKSVNFSLQLDCIDRPGNLTCASSEVLECSDTIKISLLSPLETQGSTPCHFTENVEVKWYLLPRTNKIMEINILEGKNKGHYISLLSGICGNVTCENVFDINTENIVLDPQEDLNYYLAIHGDEFSTNDFTFVLNCVDVAENDFCFTPTRIECGDSLSFDLTFANFTPYFVDGCTINEWKDVWYECTGTGDIFELRFTNTEAFGGFINLFEKGDCSSLGCITNGPWRNNTSSQVFRFVSIPGKDYLISIQHPTGAPSSFTLLCVSPAINDLCENALEWTFNDTTSIDIAGSNGDETIPCYDGQNDGVWYTFEGDGGYVSFASGDKDAAVISYILMAGECDSLTCLAQGSFTPDEILELRTDKDVRYFLLLYGSGGLIVSETGEVLPNVVCTEAEPLSCDVTFKLESGFLLPAAGTSLCSSREENTAWYTLQGNGEMYHFDFSTSGTEGSLEILLGCEDTCLHRHQIDSILPSPFSFISIPGVVYYLKINISRKKEDQNIVFSLSCAESPENFIKEKAILIECDDYSLDLSTPFFNPLAECFDPETVTYWYTFTGSDSLFSIDTEILPGISYTILNQDCDPVVTFPSGGGLFETEKDKLYYLVISHSLQDTFGRIEFSVDYECIIDNTDEVEKNDFVVRFAPNPFMGVTILTIKTLMAEEAEVVFRDNRGTKISTRIHSLEKGTNNITLSEWDNIPSGVYHVTVQTDSHIQTLRLVKM